MLRSHRKTARPSGKRFPSINCWIEVDFSLEPALALLRMPGCSRVRFFSVSYVAQEYGKTSNAKRVTRKFPITSALHQADNT